MKKIGHPEHYTQIRLAAWLARPYVSGEEAGKDSRSPEDIRQGKTIRRNPTLTEHASDILPYRVMGSGIPRALEAWPQIDLVDDPAGNQFSAVAWRPEVEWSSDAATPQVTPQVDPQVTPQVTGEVERLMGVLKGEMKRAEIQQLLGLKDRKHFQEKYLRPALEAGLVEMTIPDKPLSSRQKYRLTPQGQAMLKTGQDQKE